MAFGTRGFTNRYLKNQSKSSKPTLTKDNSFLIFPFDLTMGFITSTENGIRQNDSVNVFDYSTFQRIFTGLENVSAQWEGAYNVSLKNDNDKYLTKEYVVGRSFRGFIAEETMEATFQPTSISGDFLAEFTDETFSIHTYNDITENDLFKLFIIPGLKENKWLYITKAIRYYNKDKTLDHVELELTTLNNKIAKSGKAIEEFVQRSAPGEGYAFPSVDNDDNITVDITRAKDVPTTSLQIEGAGALAMGTIYAHGRPTIQKTENGVVEGTFNPKIEAPRLLLPLRIETAIPSPVNTRPSAETDWLIGKFKPTLSEDFGDWKEQLQSSYDLTQRAKYEGMLQSIDNANVVDNTNPVNEGTRNNVLWDPNFSFTIDKIYGTQTDQYTGDTLSIKKQITLPEMLAHNIFGLSPFTAMPLSVTQNIAWSLRDIPLIGGFATKLTFGIPIGWTNTAIKVKMADVILSIPASLKDYANVLIKDSGKLRIDLNTFTDEQANNDAIEYSGIKATGSIWKVQLTDKFYKTINGKEYKFGTLDLGQDGAKGTGTPPVADIVIQGKLLWDETCKPAPRDIDTPGYVIDTSTFKALAKMDIRTTFFSNNEQIWAGTHQTTSKFTGSIRDWTNATKYSNWKESNGKTIDYPENIVAPNPPNIQNPVITIKDLINKQITFRQSFGFIRDLTDYNANFNGQSIVPIEGDSFSPIAKEKVIGSFDTTPYGGFNTFVNNYDDITLSFKNQESGKTTFTTTKYKVNLLQLKNSGEIDIKQDISMDKPNNFVATFIGPGSSVEVPFPAPAFKELLDTIKISVNGDNIQVIQELLAEHDGTFPKLENGTRDMTLRWGTGRITTITSAIANPKQIA